jgi:hypothetical protein
VKRRDLLRKIASEAKRQEVKWTCNREGANHTVYDLDGLMIPVPRHRDIDERLAREICCQCEPKLGTDWWRA